MQTKKIILSIGTLFLLALSACEKYNQIDNNSTVKTPFTLYMGGYDGTLRVTNDLLYYRTYFNTDNSVIRQLIVADSVLNYIKKNHYYSEDEAESFPKSSNSQSPLPYVDAFKKYYYPNTMQYFKEGDSVKEVFLCTNLDADKATNGKLQVSYDLGRTFQNEARWTGASIDPSSITQLDNKKLFIIADTIVYVKPNYASNWFEVIPNTGLPKIDTAFWYIAHSHDTLLAIDFNGKHGVYWSSNEGVDWTKCSAMPTKKKILFGNQADNAFFIGYDSLGLYKLEGTQFVNASAGIPWYAKVSYLVGKQVVYRTDKIKKYLFCATDIGLYISENDGKDWRLHKDGTYSTLR
ncbi:MAG: hypothetical protein R2831_05480 [Chitinophagaceae bacterium]